MNALAVRARWRLSALAVALVLACGVAACGSDDDGDDASAKNGDAAATQETTPSGGSADEQQVRAIFDDMKDAFAKSNAEDICALMAKSAKRQVVLSTSEGGSCETIFAKLFDSGDVTEDLEPKLTKVEVDGDKATVTAKSADKALGGSDSKKPATASFVKEDGQWKVKLWLTN